jgi:hydrogenase maturation protease
VPALVLGIGNTLRGDDGAAARVLELLEGRPTGHRLEAAHGLVPELAWDISSHDAVYFVDADLAAREVTLEPVPEGGAAAGAGHAWSPARVLQLARGLGFSGDAWVCRLPVARCEVGEGLSPVAEAGARQAADLLARVAGPRD